MNHVTLCLGTANPEKEETEKHAVVFSPTVCEVYGQSTNQPREICRARIDTYKVTQPTLGFVIGNLKTRT